MCDCRRQRALVVGLFGAVVSGTAEHTMALSAHPLALQVIRRHAMIGMLHAATPAAPLPTIHGAMTAGGAVAGAGGQLEADSGDYGLLAVLCVVLRGLCGSVWLEETGLLGEEIGAVVGALAAVTLPPVLVHGSLSVGGGGGMARGALEQLWHPLMSLRHNNGQGRHAMLSLFARHDLPHAEGSRLFGEPCMLVTKKLFGPLCALAARGDYPQQGVRCSHAVPTAP